MPRLDVLDEPQHQHAIEVVAAQMRVTTRREHLEDAVLHAEDRDIERAPAEVVDGDYAFLQTIESVGERGSGRLVDDPHDVEPRDTPGVACRLSLAVVEIGGHRDDGLLD